MGRKKIQRNLFLTEKRKIRVGKHMLQLRILRPVGETGGKATGVLWVHGGGYQSGSSKDVYVTRALSLTVKFGAIVVSPDYRLSRHHPYPAGLQDCYAALLYLKNHAKELGIREDQIMIGGESAGGGMCAALCMLAKDQEEVNIAYQMPLYPMLDDRDTESSRDNHQRNWNTKKNHKAWKRYLRESWGTDLVSYYAAPARRTDYSGLPPCYTYVGRGEPFYQETADYVEHLKAAGVEAEMDAYPEEWFHAYDLLMPLKKVSQEAKAKFEAHFADAQQRFFAPQPEQNPEKTGGKPPEDMVR